MLTPVLLHFLSPILISLHCTSLRAWSEIMSCSYVSEVDIFHYYSFDKLSHDYLDAKHSDSF